ncbi:antibiotic biosynthesis monooxygenase [Actinomadura fulvescens]|uniref:Antibiotic biosynthesis monooxygenase n=1 Tax=Actinomadura fulvescens TaxID=46160 RepID=A0ABP6DAP8_9ACTN
MTTPDQPAPEPQAAGFEVFGTWRVPAPGHRQAADVIAAAWRTRPWPAPHLLSLQVLTSADADADSGGGSGGGSGGRVLVLHSRWTSENACRSTSLDQDWKRQVDAQVPGIQRTGVIGAAPYRSARHAAAEPGCVVLVTRRLCGPDPARARRLVDALFTGAACTPPAPGLLQARFLISPDGACVLNHAHWTSAAAHHAAITDVPPGLTGDPHWRQAHTWPGLASTTFQRLDPALVLHNPHPPTPT